MKILAIFIIVLLLPAAVFSQTMEDYRNFRQLFNEEKYSELYDKAMELREQQFGKNWRTDYFISIALCAGGEKEMAMRAFEYTLKTYKRDMNDDMFSFVLHERDQCSDGNSTGGIPPEQVAAVIGSLENSNNAGVRGKMGYISNCKTDPNTFTVDSTFDQSAVSERIFSVNSLNQALEYYHNFLGKGYSVSSKGRFLVVTPGSNLVSEATLTRITDELEKAYNFYAETFDIRKPNKLIAVYLMNDKYTLREVAKKIHGLNIPDSNIGYSCLADLSVLGTSSTQSIGTIKHELFHLMIRGDVGDIPTWLDESLACIYETSSWENNQLKGAIWQWRYEFMINLIMPRLSYIIEKNYDAFYPNKSMNNCEMAVNYATAKHFGLYLQENHMLQKTITAFKNRQNVFSGNSVDENDFQVLEKVFEMPFEKIMKNFDHWMATKYGRVYTDRSWKSTIEIMGDMPPCNNELKQRMQEFSNGISDKTTHIFTNDEVNQLNLLLLDIRFECSH